MSNLFADQTNSFHVEETQSKLADLFSDPPSKPTDLKFIPPKEPMLRSANLEGVDSVANVVLFANPVELFLYKEGSTKSQGRVMCCIVHDQKEKIFSLLLYRSKQHPLIQTSLHSSFSILVQPNNYAAFSDNKESKWSIHIQGQKFKEFLIQVGICRALSSYFETPTLVPNIVQNLTIGTGLPFQEGDTAKLIYSCWNVEKSTKGQTIDREKEMKVKLTKTSDVWLMGLIGAQINLHRIIFVPIKMPSDIQLVAHEVIVKKIKKKTLVSGSTPIELKEPNVPLKLENMDSEVASKQTLKLRMAKVGHPILPPKSFQSNFTDSDEDVEECKEISPSISMSSSIEEICSNPGQEANADKAYDVMASSNHMDFSASHQSPFSSGMAFKHTMPTGPMVTYHSMPYHQPMPVQSNNDPVLSLLLSESRSQNTDIRIALSRVTDKVEEIYSKVKTMEEKPATSPVASPILIKPNPKELLQQITTIVTDNESMKSQLELREFKCEELSGKLTDVVMKNHKLLEEKDDLLERASSKSASLQELSEVKKESEKLCQDQKLLKGDYDIMKERLEKRETDFVSLQEEFNDMQRELRASEASSMETVKSLTEQITKLKVDLSICEEQLAEAETSQKQLKQDEALLKKTMEREQKQFEDRIKEDKKRHENILNEQKGWYQDELNTIKYDFDRHLKLFEEKCEKRVSEEKEHSIPTIIIHEKEELKKEVDSLTTEIDLQKMEISKLTIEKSTIEEQLAHTKTSTKIETEALISEVRALKEELENLHFKLNSSTAQCSTLEDEVSRLEKEKEKTIVGHGEKETTSQFVKLIMNAVYREAKRTFDVAHKYDGVDVVQKLLIVIRDTTLLHINPPKPVRRSLDGKKTASTDEHPRLAIPKSSGEDACLISLEPDTNDASMKLDPVEPPPLPPPLFSDSEDDNYCLS